MSKWHHAALVFAVGSVFGSVMMGSGPGTSAPACRVQTYECLTVNGFCVAQSGENDPNGNPPPASQRLRLCENGNRAANAGEAGNPPAFPSETILRKCYCFLQTLIADCSSTPANYIKLDSCGTNSGGQCCFGQGRVECDTLLGSYQQKLNTSSSCTGQASNP
jgi:hypothetical protein